MRQAKLKAPPPRGIGDGAKAGTVSFGGDDANIANAVQNVEASKTIVWAGRVIGRMSRRQVWLRRRCREIQRLVLERNRHGVVTDLDAVALLIADARVFGGEVSLADVMDYGVVDDATALQAIRSVEAIIARKAEAGMRYVPISQGQAGRMLELTKAERSELDIRTADAVDETRADREAARLARRRVHDKSAKQAQRAGKRVPRQDYEERSVERARPWTALGISRATWYRQRASETGVSAHVLSTLDGGETDLSHRAEGVFMNEKPKPAEPVAGNAGDLGQRPCAKRRDPGRTSPHDLSTLILKPPRLLETIPGAGCPPTRSADKAGRPARRRYLGLTSLR